MKRPADLSACTGLADCTRHVAVADDPAARHGFNVFVNGVEKVAHTLHSKNAEKQDKKRADFATEVYNEVND